MAVKNISAELDKFTTLNPQTVGVGAAVQEIAFLAAALVQPKGGLTTKLQIFDQALQTCRDAKADDLSADQRSSSASGQVGFSAGAGGAVTQATNKSTGVTLSKPTGQITLNNASLADATTVTFTVTNTLAAATDTASVVHGSAGTGGAYLVWAHSFGAGSFKISVRNVSGGPLSEAIVLNFVLLKGANA